MEKLKRKNSFFAGKNAEIWALISSSSMKPPDLLFARLSITKMISIKNSSRIFLKKILSKVFV